MPLFGFKIWLKPYCIVLSTIYEEIQKNLWIPCSSQHILFLCCNHIHTYVKHFCITRTSCGVGFDKMLAFQHTWCQQKNSCYAIFKYTCKYSSWGVTSQNSDSAGQRVFQECVNSFGLSNLGSNLNYTFYPGFYLPKILDLYFSSSFTYILILR